MTRVKRRVLLVLQELHILPGHLNSYPFPHFQYSIFSFLFCVVFCRSLFVYLPFFVWTLCCFPSIYEFGLPLDVFKLFFLHPLSVNTTHIYMHSMKIKA